MAETATKTEKKSAKKTKAPAGGKSVRLRLFEALAKNPDGLTESQAMEKIGMKGSTTMVLKDEGCADKPRVKRKMSEGSRAVLYVITAAGKNDLEKGKVDENAAPSSAGKGWPSGR